MQSATVISLPEICCPFRPGSLSILIKHKSLDKDRLAEEFEHALGVQARAVVLSVSFSNVGNCSNLLRSCGERVHHKRSSFASETIKFIIITTNLNRLMKIKVRY